MPRPNIPPIRLFPPTKAAQANPSSKPEAAPQAIKPPRVASANPVPATATSNDENIRRYYDGHESVVRFIAALFLTAGITSLVFAVGSLAVSQQVVQGKEIGGSWIFGLVLLLPAGVCLTLAYGLARFRPWARATVMVLSVLQLAITAIAVLPLTVVFCMAMLRSTRIPVRGAYSMVTWANRSDLATLGVEGVLFCCVSFWFSWGVFRMLRSEPGETIFTDRYAQVVKRTSKVKHLGFGTGLIFLLLALVVIAMLLTGR